MFGRPIHGLVKESMHEHLGLMNLIAIFQIMESKNMLFYPNLLNVEYLIWDSSIKCSMVPFIHLPVLAIATTSRPSKIIGIVLR